MSTHPFQLTPFTPQLISTGISISGNVAKIGETLSVDFELFDPEGIIEIPDQTPSPERLHDLWEQTCFEVFIKKDETMPYWEFNLSPAGHWNIFRFNEYRLGMQEEPSTSALPITVQSKQNGLSLSLEISLNDIFPEGCALCISLCAVLKSMDGVKSYWALSHPGLEPDFHREDSFVLTL